MYIHTYIGRLDICSYTYDNIIYLIYNVLSENIRGKTLFV